MYRVNPSLTRLISILYSPNRLPDAQVGLYTILPLPVLYSGKHTNERSAGESYTVQ